MRVTERLRVEHGILLRQLHHLDTLLEEGAPPAVLQGAVGSVEVTRRSAAELESGVLLPVLGRLLGRDYGALRQAEADHRELAVLAALIREERPTREDVRRYAERLRVHLGSELSSLFAMAEETIPAHRMEALVCWEAELEELFGRRPPFAEKWLG
jgi:hypothetical protein